MEEIPIGANNTMGRKAVTGTGMASVIHHIAIHKPIAATRQANASMNSCSCPRIIINKKTPGPKSRPMS